MEESVIETYTIDSSLIEEFKEQWKTAECTIVCATDGGLKDKIGTSSYGIFLPDETTPVIYGSAGEYQPQVSASSTRQELIGQLGLEYWLSKLQMEWGTPWKALQIELITDSQASIDIMDKIPKMNTIKEVLGPEMDVAMELYRLRLQHSWIHWRVIKVESHIDITEAPDEFYWHCNDVADQLATKARRIYPESTVKQKAGYFFRGTKAICKINGRPENNNLYKILHKHAGTQDLQAYLLTKYDWAVHEFHAICWSAHHREIQRLSKVRKVTVIKYIHGWLANSQRKFFTKRHKDMQCFLCGNTEDRKHLFNCPNDKIKDLREKGLTRLIQALSKGTAQGFQQVFCTGIQTIFGRDSPDTETQMDWPTDLREAYNTQLEIGWEQVMYRRIAQHWEKLAQYNGHQGHPIDSFRWTGKAIRLCWDFGLELWTYRNQLLYGNGGGPSKVDRERVTNLIQAIYQELWGHPQYTVKPTLSQGQRRKSSLFPTPLNRRGWGT